MSLFKRDVRQPYFFDDPDPPEPLPLVGSSPAAATASSSASDSSRPRNAASAFARALASAARRSLSDWLMGSPLCLAGRWRRRFLIWIPLAVASSRDGFKFRIGKPAIGERSLGVRLRLRIGFVFGLGHALLLPKSSPAPPATPSSSASDNSRSSVFAVASFSLIGFFGAGLS